MRAKAARLERISLGRGLAALGQQDHVLERDLLAAHPIHQGQELARGERHAAQGAPERDLADLDALAERDLFRGLQERDLADLLEVEADRVLRGRGRGPQRLVGQGRRGLRLDRAIHHSVQLVVHRRRPHLADRLGGTPAALWLGRGHPELARLRCHHAVSLSKGHYGLSCSSGCVGISFRPDSSWSTPSWFRRRFAAPGFQRTLPFDRLIRGTRKPRALVPRCPASLPETYVTGQVFSLASLGGLPAGTGKGATAGA